MKTSDAIQAVIKAMCAAVEVPFVRAEQDGKRPKGLFLSYKIIRQEGEPAWRHSAEITADPDNENRTLITTRAKSQMTVSCSVQGSAAKYGELWEAAIACLAWLDSEKALPVYEAQGLMPRAVPVTVQDRSAYLETGFETRLGFDIIFDGVTAVETAVDAVDTAATIAQLAQQ